MKRQGKSTERFVSRSTGRKSGAILLLVFSLCTHVYLSAERRSYAREAGKLIGVEARDKTLPSRSGSDAIQTLRRMGQYESLKAAVINAQDRMAEAPTDAFTLRKKLTASQPEGLSSFGESVAISGFTAVVGALNQTVNGQTFQGAAYVFVRTGNNWIEQARLTAPDGEAGDRFGYSVAIDGERIVVGASDDWVGGVSDQGSAYVFVRTGTVWNEEARLNGSDSNGGDQFGSSVAISGVTVAVGSNNGITGRTGAVYVFVKGTTWTQQQKLLANDAAAGDAFGFQRAIALDGHTMIVGARFASVGGNPSRGSAYVFTRSGSTWSQQQKLTAPDGVDFSEFGFSVAISGETAVIGAWQDVVDGAIKGSAYVFVRTGIFWTVQQKLTASDGQSQDHFGRSVGIDGETVIVGLEPSVFVPRPGSAYVFVRSGNSWTQQQKLTGSNLGFNDHFGSSVAIRGATAIVGATLDATTLQDQGAAYVFGSSSGSGSFPEKITFSSQRDGNDEIYVMNPDGSAQRRLTNDAGSDLHPSFSGDGSQITFSSTRDGNAEIYVMNTDGSNQARITNSAASDTQPSFSRDGLRIVFCSQRDGNDEIYSMNADGSNVLRLTNNSISDTDPSFSPAGSRIIYESDGAVGNRDIFIMNSNGSAQTRLTTATGADLSANFSRDGTRITFGSARNGNNEIYAMNADGTGQTRLTNNAFSDVEPGFSPDGTKIVFQTDRDANSEIYVMNSNGTDQARITSDLAADSAPDWGGIAELQSAGGRITSGDGMARDFFGASVAISGNTAIVGAPGDDFGTSSSQGSAYVFVRIAGVWLEQQKLVSADGADSDEFGFSVAISGETVVIGARNDDLDSGFDQGSAYVFVRNGTVWTQQQKLTASDAANIDSFGYSVAISGETTIVGAISDDVGGNANQGSTYVFVRNGSSWTEQQKLLAVDGALQDNFGASVGISGDTAVVGAYNDDVGSTSNQGSAYVFVRGGSTWTQQQQLTASDGSTQDAFGFSVAISGGTIVVGSPLDDVGTTVDQGSAYTFVSNGSSWPQQQKLIVGEGAATDFTGWSVSISGETVILGAYLADLAAANQGVAYTFVRTGPTWTQFQKFAAPNAATNDNFGRSVGIDGENAIIGALNKNIGANLEQGAAYIFATRLPPGRARADFDGDGRTDVSVFRNSDATWYLHQSRDGLRSVRFGSAGDVPVPGDYDGDGRADLAVFRPNSDPAVDDYLVLYSGTSTFSGINWGLPGDRPVAGDFNGDGRADPALYRDSDNRFYVLTSATTFLVEAFGSAGDIPMGIDLDGDGRTQIAVFRPSTAEWRIARQTGTPSQNFDTIVFGLATDTLVPADYDGDDREDIAVFRSGTWYIRRSSDGSFRVVQFGLASDIPSPGDYDGDGMTDIAIYRGGDWWILRSTSGSASVEQFGLPADKPLPTAFGP